MALFYGVPSYIWRLYYVDMIEEILMVRSNSSTRDVYQQDLHNWRFITSNSDAGYWWNASLISTPLAFFKISQDTRSMFFGNDFFLEVWMTQVNNRIHYKTTNGVIRQQMFIGSSRYSFIWAINSSNRRKHTGVRISWVSVLNGIIVIPNS